MQATKLDNLSAFPYVRAGKELSSRNYTSYLRTVESYSIPVRYKYILISWKIACSVVTYIA